MQALKYVAAASLLLTALPVLAQTPAPTPGAPASDTVKIAIERGTKIDAGGMVYEQTYKPDGTYTGAAEGDAGKYRADGKKLCLTPDALGQEICVEYPDGKKAGESFEAQSDFGVMTVSIK
jgi:hypothetical protein